MVYSDQPFSEENADDRRDRHLKSRPRDRRISKTDRMFARGSRGKLRRVTCVQLAISEIRYKRRIRYSYPMEYWPPPTPPTPTPTPTTPMTTTVYTLVCRARLKKTPTGQREKEEHEGESIARVFLRSTIGRTNTSRYLQCTYCSPSLLLSDTFLPPAVSVCSVVCTFPPPGTLHRSSSQHSQHILLYFLRTLRSGTRGCPGIIAASFLSSMVSFAASRSVEIPGQPREIARNYER